MESVVFNRVLTASQAWCDQFTTLRFVLFQKGGQWRLARWASFPVNAQVHSEVPSPHLLVFPLGLSSCCEQGLQCIDLALSCYKASGWSCLQPLDEAAQWGDPFAPVGECRELVLLTWASHGAVGEIPEPWLSHGIAAFSSFPSYLLSPDGEASLSFLILMVHGEERPVMNLAHLTPPYPLTVTCI